MSNYLIPCGGLKLSKECFSLEKGNIVKVIGDGAGVTDFSGLTGKPQINGHELASGNNTLETLGITKAGLGIKDYTLPQAKTNTLGGVKQATAVPEASGENVTKAEFKALLDTLKTAGIMASA